MAAAAPELDASTQRSFPRLKRYDYIIAGGGTAGLVLAARLSENSKKSILVVEAGGNRIDDDNINVPGFMGKLWGDPNYDWNFWTEPQVRRIKFTLT